MHPAAIARFAALKTRFIVNPNSGRAAGALAAVRTFAVAHGAEFVLTGRTRHASELAAQAVRDACALVVAVGGDGTMNEVAGALAGTPAILGLVPCGSGNGLGRHLQIHGSISRALRVLEAGRPRLIDSGLADGHAFFNVAGLGFEAEIARRFNALPHRGFARYLTTGLAAWRDCRPTDYVITHQGRTERVRAFTLAVANSDQYGNGARIAPSARVDDGLLDLCAIPPVSLWRALPLLFRLFRGTLAHAPGVTRLQAEHFVVEPAGPGLLHTDGELHAAGARIEFAVRPASLRVMGPA